MANPEVNCANCYGATKGFCEQMVAQELGLIQTCQSFDYDELEWMGLDPDKSEEDIAAMEEATLQESKDLVDYRSQQLAKNLLKIGCGLDEPQTHQKLTLRLAGY